MIALTSQQSRARTGNHAAWHVRFHAEERSQVKEDVEHEVGAGSHHAEVQATLPEGLQGGAYSLVVEGMSDEDYKKVWGLWTGGGHVLVARLYLMWRDANSDASAMLSGALGLGELTDPVSAMATAETMVAELRVTRVSRRAGPRTYEGVFEMRERVFDILARRRVTREEVGTLNQMRPIDAAKHLASTWGITATRHPASGEIAAVPPTDAERGASLGLRAGKTGVETLQTLGGLMEQMSGKFGRGMYLIRDGKLNIGPRPIPLAEGSGAASEPLPLWSGNGLLLAEHAEALLIEPNFDYAANPTATPRSREGYRLVLKGRTDLKPGSVVQFKRPPGEEPPEPMGVGAAMLGALGALSGGLLPSDSDEPTASDPQLYLTGVKHRMGRTSGLVTEAHGIAIGGPHDAWDPTDPAGSRASAAPAASGAERAAESLDRYVLSVVRGMHLVTVGEVRGVNATDAGGPRQTSTVWRGLAGVAGEANDARTKEVERPSLSPATTTPYLTPFAWGKCGLILPRYPGVRVVVGHNEGRQNDPIDFGSVFKTGQEPDEAQVGDWWLVLPVIDPEPPALGDAQAVEPHRGPVSQDLIDRKGKRFIELKELTIRVGGSLRDAGKRPDPSAVADSVTIEHVGGGSRITMESNGNITIKGSNITLDATGGNIVLKASNVDVQ